MKILLAFFTHHKLQKTETDLPLHSLHQCHFIWGGGDVKGSGFALVDAMLDSIHCLLLLYLHCVAQTQCAEKQILMHLWWITNVVLSSVEKRTQ